MEPLKAAGKHTKDTFGRVKWGSDQKTLLLSDQFNKMVKSIGSYHKQNFQMLFYKTDLDDTF